MLKFIGWLALPTLSLSGHAEDLFGQVKRDTAKIENADMMVFSYRKAVQAARDGVVTVTVKQWEKQPTGDISGFDWRMESGFEGSPPAPGPVGSGIVLTESGLILTNHHVVAGAGRITLRGRSMAEEIEAEIVGSDAGTDVALLRARSGVWQPVVLGDNAHLETGDVVLALGSPYGLEQSVTLGIISGTGRTDLRGIKSSLQDFIQTDAAIHPGNSGGPLVDGLGRVVGMNTARYGGETIGLAVPVNLALKVAQDLLTLGRVQRGMLGIRLATLNEKLAQELAFPIGTRGVTILEVEKGEAGDRGGLLPGDLITAIDDQPVRSVSSLLTRMTLLKAGDAIRLTVSRGGKVERREMILGSPSDAGPLAKTLSWELTPGLKVSLVDERLRNKLLLPPQLKALLVLEDFTSGSGQPLLAGDLIIQVNNQPLTLAAQQPDPIANLRFKTPVLMLKIIRKEHEYLIGVVQPSE